MTIRIPWWLWVAGGALLAAAAGLVALALGRRQRVPEVLAPGLAAELARQEQEAVDLLDADLVGSDASLVALSELPPDARTEGLAQLLEAWKP